MEGSSNNSLKERDGCLMLEGGGWWPNILFSCLFSTGPLKIWYGECESIDTLDDLGVAGWGSGYGVEIEFWEKDFD